MPKSPAVFISALAGIANTLPASAYAQQQLQRAADAGFKWPTSQLVIGKMKEELREVHEAIVEGDTAHIQEEIGDLLHATHTLAVFYKLDVSDALALTIPQPAATSASLLAHIDTRLAQIEAAIAHYEGRDFRHGMEDLLQAVHQLARQHGVNPEQALHGTNRKFAHRFTRMEQKLALEGNTIPGVIETHGLKHLVKHYWDTEKAGAGGVSRA